MLHGVAGAAGNVAVMPEEGAAKGAEEVDGGGGGWILSMFGVFLVVLMDKHDVFGE